MQDPTPMSVKSVRGESKQSKMEEICKTSIFDEYFSSLEISRLSCNRAIELLNYFTVYLSLLQFMGSLAVND